MKNKLHTDKKKTSGFVFSRWSFDYASLNAILRVKAETQFVNLFIKVKQICGGIISKSFIKSIKVCILQLREIQRKQGDRGLVIFLKTCSVSLQQAASGYKISDTRPIGSRLARSKGSRFPRIICSQHRAILNSNNKGKYILIRFYLTLFYCYRVIVFRPYVVKLGTIIQPGVEFNADKLFGKYYANFLYHFIKDKKILFDPLSYFKRKFKFFNISKSSPNNMTLKDKKSLWSTHPLVMMYSAMAILNSEKIMNIFVAMAMGYCPQLIHLINCSRFKMGSVLGKLAFKEEPAGKLRVFAIVDCFTQWLLSPIHKVIFLILKRIPMDGTFNQLAPVHRLIRLNCKQYYSLDLTAATDRLPISIQKELLNEWVKEIWKFGDKWAELLVARLYYWNKPKGAIVKDNLPGAIQYEVGQPMGALSSWAMLALTHHFIVQVAAWRVGHPRYKLFTKYALLGDDLVVGDRGVAYSYLKIMNNIGVGINLSKSILSHKGKGLEFAKRTFIDGVDVSPISLKDLSLATQPRDISSWVAFANSWKLNFQKQAYILGYRKEALHKGFRRLNSALKVLFLCNIAKVDFNTQVLNLRYKVPKDLEQNLDLFKEQVLKPNYDILLSNYEYNAKEEILELNEKYATEGMGQAFFVNAAPFIYDTASINGTHLESNIRGSTLPQIVFELEETFRDFVSVMVHASNVKDVSFFEEPYDNISGNITMNTYQLNIDMSKSRIFLPDVYLMELDVMKITSLDEALDCYLRLKYYQSLIDVDILRLKHSSKRISTKLPYQARMWRAWSRVVVNTVKRSKQSE